MLCLKNVFNINIISRSMFDQTVVKKNKNNYNFDKSGSCPFISLSMST